MNIYRKFRHWLTLQKATRIYLWWVVIRWFLRWIVTGLFLMWIWFLATDARKEEFQNQLRFKVQAPTVEWSRSPMNIYTTNGVRRIKFGLREDGVVLWRLDDVTEDYQ